ncbi:unnamed protein product [Echinostoma caproni]|uniref:HCO3_cotransp domain-containing protein n=1 Tax=Echinostoma caproni TaxID=27848 RepID=A0A183AJF7_9TREM|nr:unnamed protein product [Echinostoma caproni]
MNFVQPIRAKQIIVMNQNMCGNQCYFYLILAFLVTQAFVLILLVFYYAKYLVVASVFVFAAVGIIAMAYVGQCAYCSRFERKLVGFPLQCIMATFIVQFLLSFVILLPSLKADGKSIIETLLTQQLGFDGSSVPGGFRISILHYSGSEHGNCSYMEYTGLLPFAHVLLPGYIVGQVVVNVIRAQTGHVHPSLLYLVPCTLAPSIIVTLLFGGLGEIRQLWTGDFLDEDHDLDELNEKHPSHIPFESSTKDMSFDSD